MRFQESKLSNFDPTMTASHLQQQNMFRMNTVMVKIRVSCNLSLPLFNETFIVQSSVRILHKNDIILNRHEMFFLGTSGKWCICFLDL